MGKTLTSENIVGAENGIRYILYAEETVLLGIFVHVII
jgi:hypothetical protein